MKPKLDRIISLATLAASMIAIVLVLKRPAPVAQPQTPASIAQPTPSLTQTTPADSSQRPQTAEVSVTPATEAPRFSPSTTVQPTASNSTTSSNAKSDPHPNSSQLNSMLEHLLGGGSDSGSSSLDAKAGEGEPNIKDQQVSVDGDVIHGKFLTEIAGKDVWVTISGHIGEKDGYATFDPTEIKVGDTDVPVSLVNPLLQKKMAEQRDRLKVRNAP